MAEPYAMFQRLDRSQEGAIRPLDMLKFLRENKVTRYHEADCYYVIRFFDSEGANTLSYAAFLQMILPCENSLLRSIATQRTNA